MTPAQQDAMYMRLWVAFQAKPGDSLEDAAQRVVRLRRRQIIAARALLKSQGEPWERIKHADEVAARCRW